MAFSVQRRSVRGDLPKLKLTVREEATCTEDLISAMLEE